jgi:hypothetical protein
MTQALPERASDALPRSFTRYVPAKLSGVLHWGIWDHTLGAWCTLPNGAHREPLEWHSREEAEVWLYLCRVAWRMGLVDAPDGWAGY